MTMFRVAMVTLVCASQLSMARAETARFPSEIASAIVDVRALLRRIGGKFWHGLDQAPSGFLLVEQERELLACEDRLPDGFRNAGRDQVLDCMISIGPRSWRQSDLLAAMPVFGPPSTIVMGSPQNTGKTLAEWQATVIHENFHQWQASLPRYYERVSALDLANGDQTGMWMLNYAFPYADADVQSAFALAAIALADAIEAPRGARMTKGQAYLKARQDLEAKVSSRDWRYFEFQLWQEGVARWTELSVAERAKSQPLAEAGRALRVSVLKDLRTPNLQRDGRLAVYSFGAGEAMLLERMRPGWRKCYQRELSLGPLFRKACE
jgi:hypothetical protein